MEHLELPVGRRKGDGATLEIKEGPYFSASGEEEHAHLEVHVNTNYVTLLRASGAGGGKPYKFRMVGTKLVSPSNKDVPNPPFEPKVWADLKKYKTVHRLIGKKDDSLTGKFWFKATYELENGQKWDPHFTVDWP